MVVPELINLPLEGEADAIATVWMENILMCTR